MVTIRTRVAPGVTCANASPTSASRKGGTEVRKSVRNIMVGLGGLLAGRGFAWRSSGCRSGKNDPARRQHDDRTYEGEPAKIDTVDRELVHEPVKATSIPRRLQHLLYDHVLCRRHQLPRRRPTANESASTTVTPTDHRRRRRLRDRPHHRGRCRRREPPAQRRSARRPRQQVPVRHGEEELPLLGRHPRRRRQRGLRRHRGRSTASRPTIS